MTGMRRRYPDAGVAKRRRTAVAPLATAVEHRLITTVVHRCVDRSSGFGARPDGYGTSVLPTGRHADPDRKDPAMSLLVILLIVAALVFGGIGLFLEAAAWALIVALVLVVAGVIVGFVGRGRAQI